MKTFRAHLVSAPTSSLGAQDPVVPAGHLVIPANNPTLLFVGDGVKNLTELTPIEKNVSTGGTIG